MEMLPREVYRMCVAGALVVGSRALAMAGAIPKDAAATSDYDLLVPYEHWQRVTPFIPAAAVLNKFGGWRFVTDKGVEVDVWPGSITQYLRECKSKHGIQVCVVDYIQNRVYSSSIQQLC